MHHDHPQLVRDQYWEEVFPQGLPYTLASEPFREEHPQPSTANITVKPKDGNIVRPPSRGPSTAKLDSINDMTNSGITFTAKPSSTSLFKKKNSQTSMAQGAGSVPGKY